MLDRDDVIAIIQAIQHTDTIRTSDVQRMAGIGYTKAVRILMDLQNMGLVQREKKPGSWKIKQGNIRKYLLLNTAN